MANLYELPSEILIKIFKNLNYYDTLNMALVCKRFLEIFEYPKVLQKLSLNFSNELPDENFLENFTRMFPHIEFQQIDLNCFQDFLKRQSNCIQSLRFESMTLERNLFFNILKNMKNLTSLTLRKCIFYVFPMSLHRSEITNKKSDKKNFDSLSFLEMEHSSLEIYLHIMKILRSSNLQNIKLSIAKPSNNSRLTNIVDNDNNNNVTNLCCCDFLQPLLNIKLKSFEIHNVQLNCCKRNIFLILNNNVNMIDLKIIQSNIFIDNDIVQITNILKCLEIFHIESCYNLTNVSALCLEKLKNLREVKVAECSGILSGINGSGIRSGILKELNLNLTILILIYVDINTESMIKICENLPNLKKLIFQYPISSRMDTRRTCKIMDFALQAIISNCKFLEHLELSGCYWLTDFGTSGYNTETNRKEGMSINNLVNLTVLNLYGCEKVTDFFLLNTNFQLLKLKSLRLPKLSKKSIQVLMDNCIDIEELDIKCSLETDLVVDMAIRSFRLLKHIIVTRFCAESKKLLNADVWKHDRFYGFKMLNCSCSICEKINNLFKDFQN